MAYNQNAQDRNGDTVPVSQPKARVDAYLLWLCEASGESEHASDHQAMALRAIVAELAELRSLVTILDESRRYR